MQLRQIQHGVTDSTSERAFAAIAEGSAAHGDVHVADSQTAGRGRLGRVWVSEPGTGLYLSLVLLPAETIGAAALTMAAGLAVLDSVRELGVADAGLKWPNDVVINGAKLAGILVETRGLDPRTPHYVVGIGVNVLQREFPRELTEERPVTSLALEGCAADRDRALAALLPHLVTRLEGSADGAQRLASDFLEATGLAGCEVVARTGETEVSGTLVALSLEQGVTLRGANGAVRHIALEFVREFGAL